jgi:hypothetical protein
MYLKGHNVTSCFILKRQNIYSFNSATYLLICVRKGVLGSQEPLVLSAIAKTSKFSIDYMPL